MYKYFISTFAVIILAACSPNNVKQDNTAEPIFKQNNFTGTFCLYDNGQGSFDVFNLNYYKDSSLPPMYTFNTLLSLIGLQTGCITNEKAMLQSTCNSKADSINLAEAFKINSTSFFNCIAKQIGKDTLQLWLDSLKYGNKKIVSADSFWLNSSIKLTPDEQLGFIKNLYFEKLPFQKRVQDIVKRILIVENNANYQLAYSKSITSFNASENLVWAVGWIEENKHPYFFVVSGKTNSAFNMQQLADKIIKPILKQKGFFEGKR